VRGGPQNTPTRADPEDFIFCLEQLIGAWQREQAAITLMLYAAV
jgi:hypothetical protein